MMNRNASDHSSIVPDHIGEQNSFHLYFDPSRNQTSVSLLNESPTTPVEEYMMKIDDFSDLSPQELNTVASEVTKLGLQKAYTRSLIKYERQRGFKKLNLTLLVLLIIISSVVITLLLAHYDFELQKLCAFNNRCLSLKSHILYLLVSLYVLGDILVIFASYTAFRTYNSRSIKQYGRLQTIYIICMISWVITLNIIAILIGAYLLFQTVKLVETTKKLSALEKYRTRSLLF